MGPYKRDEHCGDVMKEFVGVVKWALEENVLLAAKLTLKIIVFVATSKVDTKSLLLHGHSRVNPENHSKSNVFRVNSG